MKLPKLTEIEWAAEVLRLRAALNVAREVCGKNNCNCPGADRVKAAIEAIEP